MGIGVLVVGWVVALVAVVGAVTWWLTRNRDAPAISHWQRSWFFLFAAGAGLAVTDSAAWWVAAARLLAPFFPALTLAGALVYAGRAVPVWLLPAAGVLGVARLVASGLGAPAVDYGLAGIESLAVLASAVLAWPVARRARRYSSAAFLVPAFAAVAVLEAVDSAVGLLGISGGWPWHVGWLVVGPATIWIQIRVDRAGLRGRERRVGQALSDSAARFRALTENAFDLITEMDATGRFTYANARCEELCGAPAAQLLNRQALDWVHPEDLDATRAWFRGLRDEGREALLTGRVRHRDGSWRWVEVSGRTFRFRGELRIVANYRDVSDRVELGERLKRANEDLEAAVVRRTAQLNDAVASLEREVAERRRVELELRSSEERWRNVSELSSDLSFSILRHADGSLITEWVTEAITRMTGRSRAEIDERGWSLVSAAEDMEVSIGHLMAIRAGETREYDGRLLTLLGKERWVRIRITGVPGPLPGELRILGAGVDVTDARRAEEERRHLEAHLQEAQKLESLGVLAGGVAHDFNNLLAVILGNSSLALQGSDAGSPLEHQLERIRTAARHAEALTSQMLTYSGKGSLSLKPLDLSKLVEEMSELLESAVSVKCQLDFSLSHGKTVVEGDPTQLRQVVMNLVSNASEALRERPGRVVARTGLMSATEEYLADTFGTAGLAPGSYVFFEVSDPGEGIEPEVRKRIFDPFFSTKFTGRGLGLATVLGIVRGHGGGIKLVSESGTGTRMRVLFPLAEGAVASPAAPARGGGAPECRGRVLVVDDNEAVRDLAREILVRGGLDAITAAGGREALAILAGEGGDRIDAVVLDVAMPDLDGVETLGEMRKLRPALPVVIASGYGENRPQRVPDDGAATVFVNKPYDPASLVDGVRQALAGD